MAGLTAWVLGDQLSFDNPALEGADRILLVESEAKLRSGRFHRQKLHLVLSAMRHFARDARKRGFEVDHVRAGGLAAGVREHRRRFSPDRVRLLAPSSMRGRDGLTELPGVERVEGSLFLTDTADFETWGSGRRRMVMEDFYRRQRRRLGLLMDGDEPVEGRWNFDAENRESPPKDRKPPRLYAPREDAIDDEVRADLDSLELQTFGEDRPRLWPATHAEARRALDAFVQRALPDFGRWQDAMVRGERYLWHSGLSSSLNLGLLDPLDCAKAAERAYRQGDAPISAVEGFVRQIIGWREYVWCMYWYEGERWRRSNALGARTGLPEVFWTGETGMACIADAVTGLQETAYAHHIERLMLFGNLILLLGVKPREAFDWFHQAFIDGYEWVMEPNVTGMATFADGGRMMTKPYAASGRYVNRMSDHCKPCRYDPTKRLGEDACPFTTLYWDFLDRNRKTLAGNHRMQMPMKNLDRMDPGELAEIRSRGLALRRRFSV